MKKQQWAMEESKYRVVREMSASRNYQLERSRNFQIKNERKNNVRNKTR